MLGPARPEKWRYLATAGLIAGVMVAVAAGGYGLSLLVVGQGGPWGYGLLILGVVSLLLTFMLYCQIALLAKFVSYSYRMYDAMLETVDQVRRQTEYTRTISENSSLSEWAKRIVYREKDYEFLRDTIQSAIVRQDWEAAEHLISDMERQFGYHDEAAHLREQLDRARRATTEERVADALARFDSLCKQHKWEQAVTECERLNALFPGNPSIAGLPREIELRRQEVKQKLLKDYDVAVRNQDIDRAHRLLFALDQYLVPQEAEALKESARGVFRARLEQIKTQFTIAVSYKQFGSAIEAGERLIREFPNSGYAREISKLLPILRERMKHDGPVDVGATTPPAHN